MMFGETFDQQITQAKEALRTYQPAVALTQLTKLLALSLAPAQQALTHALLADAYHQQSRWAEANTTLRPYAALDARSSFPQPTQHLLCLRLAVLKTEQGIFDEAINFAR